MVMAPPATRDLAVSPCFHGCLAFLHRHFPPQSPPSHPLHKSLRNEQQPSPWDCSTTPKLQLLACAFQKTGVPVWGMYGCGKDCLMLIPFRLPQTSLVAQSVKNLPAVRRPGFDLWVGKIPWRRKWQPTPVSLPGKSHGERSLVGCSPWVRQESGMTE